MELYTAIDLHSNSNYLGIIDEKGNRVYNRKRPLLSLIFTMEHIKPTWFL